MKFLKLCVVLSALAITASAAARQSSTYHYKYRGNGADASFDSWNECGGTYASVWLQEGMQMAGGPRYTFGGGSFYFNNYDWCTGESTYGWGDLSSATYNLRGTRGASVSYTGEALIENFLGCDQILCPCVDENEWGWCEYQDDESWYGCWCDYDSGQCYRDECHWEYTPVPVSIDLTWTPSGDITRGMYSYMNRYNDYFYRYRSVGSWSAADVQGSFVVGELDYCSESMGVWGSLSSSTSGDLYISHALR